MVIESHKKSLLCFFNLNLRSYGQLFVLVCQYLIDFFLLIVLVLINFIDYEVFFLYFRYKPPHNPAPHIIPLIENI